MFNIYDKFSDTLAGFANFSLYRDYWFLIASLLIEP